MKLGVSSFSLESGALRFRERVPNFVNQYPPLVWCSETRISWFLHHRQLENHVCNTALDNVRGGTDCVTIQQGEWVTI